MHQEKKPRRVRIRLSTEKAARSMLRHESNGKEILQTWDSYSTPHAKLQVTCSIQSRGADCCTCTVSGASLIPYGIMMAVVVPFAATGRTPLAALLSHVEDTVHMHMHCDIWMRPSPNSTCTGDVETLPTRPRTTESGICIWRTSFQYHFTPACMCQY